MCEVRYPCALRRREDVDLLAVKDRAYSNSHVVSWVNEMAKMCQPDQIYWCDGTQAEAKALLDEAIATGVLIPQIGRAHV